MNFFSKLSKFYDSILTGLASIVVANLLGLPGNVIFITTMVIIGCHAIAKFISMGHFKSITLFEEKTETQIKEEKLQHMKKDTEIKKERNKQLKLDLEEKKLSKELQKFQDDEGRDENIQG